MLLAASLNLYSNPNSRWKGTQRRIRQVILQLFCFRERSNQQYKKQKRNKRMYLCNSKSLTKCSNYFSKRFNTNIKKKLHWVFVFTKILNWIKNRYKKKLIIILNIKMKLLINFLFIYLCNIKNRSNELVTSTLPC